MKKYACILRPLCTEQHTINLSAGVHIIGRSKHTGITDISCSKQQIELQTCFEKFKIRLKVLGVNPSGVNGFMLMRNVECDLIHGDILDVVYGRNTFEVLFEPLVANALKADGSSKSLLVERKSTEFWNHIEDGGMIVFNAPGVQHSEKIAAYDLDGTIIRTKSGKVFPKSYTDWNVNYQEVRSQLKDLFEDGYKICVFTNQGGIEKGKVKLDEFKLKIMNIQKELDVPMQVFIATSNGFYRKPKPGMWQHLEEYGNNNIRINLDKSFFVGDAAGRPERGSGSSKKRKDHSISDRLFAANIGLNFYTPEEHFLGTPTESFIKPEFEPRDIDNIKESIFEPKNAKIPSNHCEILLLVGLPGSGKSHFAHNYLQSLGYQIFNADTIGSTQACLKGCQETLRKSRSCVVDNTNIDIQARKKFIDLAKIQNVLCRCLLMNVGLPQIKHNIAYRQLVDTKHVKINDFVLNTIKKKYIEPTVNEGFEEIIRINPKFQFNDAKFENLYKLYLVEK